MAPYQQYDFPLTDAATHIDLVSKTGLHAWVAGPEPPVDDWRLYFSAVDGNGPGVQAPALLVAWCPPPTPTPTETATVTSTPTVTLPG